MVRRLLAKKDNSAEFALLASRISAALKFGARAGEDVSVKVKALIIDH